jgi:hypothetical protein
MIFECISRASEILGWEGVGNCQLFSFFKYKLTVVIYYIEHLDS